MISKIKKPVSILLVFMMIVSLFAAVPMTVNAAPPDSGPGSGPGGTGTVITPTTAGNVAEINGTQHATLEAAIEAAPAGGTVKLIANVTETVTVSGKTLTLDLNGFNITSALSSKMAVNANNGAKLTINNSNTAKSEAPALITEVR